jgi:hypothetical protein
MTFDIGQDHSIQLDASRTLWLTEISRHTFQDQGLDDLESDDGLFIALEDTTAGTFVVLAKAASSTMGLDLMRLVASQTAWRAL